MIDLIYFKIITIKKKFVILCKITYKIIKNRLIIKKSPNNHIKIQLI
jgi:hypothetical protein